MVKVVVEASDRAALRNASQPVKDMALQIWDASADTVENAILNISDLATARLLLVVLTLHARNLEHRVRELERKG